MKTIVLATGNAGKLAEMREILAPLALSVQPQSGYFTEEAVEDGLSFIENALIKARFASEKTGLPSIADDSGLEVDFLQGRPGIYSARYSEGYQGQAASDSLNNQKLVDELDGVPTENRQACYYCAMVYVRHSEDPTPLIGLGQWCGTVLEAPSGTGGFGYDPLIWMADEGCSVAELPKTVKNKISHRAKALQALVAQLK
ncbi:RdgB/HAM1 family non-canonical purine NTP pyrophosphatase [Hydrogenovibrio sp. 3SP14C1]|uniref:RdgB/HAM1 family non-canonical purine NTP pyrophosphatase n=1 Tax=Hydrogenovibrio sp. 3SP14C1 TaxID=3038774 RepID=UPI00241725EC|nr:RdgB/HAM1 family non-canonical purine NTP pyrophosphatase [Hydrogenovibrio sp. 3SP14C1]MDG4811487.1 RdgB/HAM1 family non-canonical purine NTP pyrophosphatase [Hydrogenovibrio sp. 3SP14C1]